MLELCNNNADWQTKCVYIFSNGSYVANFYGSSYSTALISRQPIAFEQLELAKCVTSYIRHYIGHIFFLPTIT